MPSSRVTSIIFSVFLIIIILAAGSNYISPTQNEEDNTKTPEYVLLGSNELGKVTREGPYGNTSSNIEIAYIMGVHPLESNAHRAIIESIKSNQNKLKYYYYIYQVHVKKDADNYKKGRMNGQLLAREFVVKDIIIKDYKLVIDIHSHRGEYKESRFIFAPVQGGRAEEIAHSIENRIPWMVYHFPYPQTSPPYVTIPINNEGIPTVLYETYSYEAYSTTRYHADDFVSQVDNLIF
ncbi:MAG: hypothetical protein QME14_04645 [Methanobacteriaceae archaeon]|nr:hypothetical protein [Methanobacteriaceae archaeon]